MIKCVYNGLTVGHNLIKKNNRKREFIDWTGENQENP